MKHPYISRVHIQNYRNFENVDFYLSDKQVLIGENNVGKSNLIRAIQLILDPSLSDEDRVLDESDFFSGLDSPMENDKEILIELYIDSYEHIKNILCVLSDATVIINGKRLLKLTYKFYPQIDTKGRKDYVYSIYKGNDEKNLFTYENRKYLNMRVIRAIRDVESEMKNSKSPLAKLINRNYKIDKQDLERISEALKNTGANVLDLPEIGDLQGLIDKMFNSIISFSADQFDISLRTMDIDATRVLYALKPLINSREAKNTSLGINNILYITLMLLLIQDNTIKTYLTTEKYEELIENENSEIIKECYLKQDQGYTLLEVDAIKKSELYNFLDGVYPSSNGVTILAIEEPEAHLHPIFQRLLYKYVANNVETSVIVTTHSTHIAAVAPIKSIVHLINTGNETEVFTTALLSMDEKEMDDITRYIDVKRGEIYLAKGIIFVEGISEEYLIPCLALKMGLDLDRLGVVICNINSTNFIPYRRFADALGIPNAIVTDGDYYYINEEGKRKYGSLESEGFQNGFNGNERMVKLCKDLYEVTITDVLENQDTELSEYGIFVGYHTFEIDIFNTSENEDMSIICDTFDELTKGGDGQKTKFKAYIESGDYYKCLSQIESSYSEIGKGRFAQRLSKNVTESMIPNYIFNAIRFIYQVVSGDMDE